MTSSYCCVAVTEIMIRGRYGRGAPPSRDRRPHGAWRLRGGALLLARGVRRPCDGAQRLRGQPYFLSRSSAKGLQDLRKSPDTMLTATRQVCCGRPIAEAGHIGRPDHENVIA